MTQRTQSKPVPTACFLQLQLEHWRQLQDVLLDSPFTQSAWIWRGHRDATWPLHTSLNRLLNLTTTSQVSVITALQVERHLERFKLATRGRPGVNKADLLTENDWWSLGQHNGLATPLLDWSDSPYVALYFAFENKQSSPRGDLAIWALDKLDVSMRSNDSDDSSDVKNSGLALVRPAQHDNPRLLSQAGLFTRLPLGSSVEDWVCLAYRDVNAKVLVKICFPDTDREQCLTYLNLMNINHMTVFPDLHGACRHCNGLIDQM